MTKQLEDGLIKRTNNKMKKVLYIRMKIVNGSSVFFFFLFLITRNK